MLDTLVMRVRCAVAAVAAVLLVAIAACSHEPEGAVATWTVDRAREPQRSSTSFLALVSRLGCHGGVTGDVLPPEIDHSDTRIVVTFSVTPVPDDNEVFNCRGNDRVSYTVRLDEPLGHRTLVDGNCLPGREAATTMLCGDAGERFRPE